MRRIDVAIVDDEPNVLNSLKRVFRDEPFEVFLTTDHKEVFRMMRKNRIKVVMSDQRMPEITGVKFLKKIKERYPHAINILFTGYADIKIAEDAINEGEVYRFLNKPWDDKDLKAIVKQALDKYELEEKNRKLAENIKKQNKKLISLNNKLKNMYEAQKIFTSTVSHELRTPLASIRTILDMIIRKTLGNLNKKQKDFLKKAKNNVDRLNRLINDILDLSKLEFEGTRLNKKRYKINNLIKEVVSNYKPVAEQQGLYLKTELDKSISKTEFDVDYISQVLNNLINNAIKFTSSGGITVSSEIGKSGENVKICVKDTGQGIHRSDIPKLFKKFKQLARPRSEEVSGTGLGLAICKEIITRHGGKIWVKSQHGKGSSFCFTLPCT